MEELIKDSLPKEVIESVPVIEELVEPEPSGLTLTQGICIVVVVAVAAVIAKKVRECKKK